MKDPLELNNKKVVIIGFARSGMATAEFVLKLKGIPKITDHRPQKEAGVAFDRWDKKDRVEFEWGRHTKEFLSDAALLVLSPGVRINAPAVRWARELSIPVMGEVELAWRLCPCPVIAITGSNGKTTVATLIAEIFQKAGKNICLCGNIGSPFSRYVLDLKEDSIVVLEISSFQLESIIDFRPHTAVFLNFSQNHLDRHKDMEEYFLAKSKMFFNQTKNDNVVLNDQDPALKKMASQLKANITFFNTPEQRRGCSFANPNFLAALEVSRLFNVDKKTACEAIRSFKGVEHRMELVRSINEVDFINDSKATTVEAARWALERIDKPIIMISGGKDKNMDFSVLRNLMTEKVKKMFVIGEARQKIKGVFKDIMDVEESSSLESAAQKSLNAAQSGDCVVLCPMCASFDMFDDYEHRGRIFKEIVGKL